MWNCSRCSERLDDDFDVCWKCGTGRSGVENPDFQPEDLPITTTARDVDCIRCGRALDFMGVRHLGEDTA